MELVPTPILLLIGAAVEREGARTITPVKTPLHVEEVETEDGLRYRLTLLYERDVLVDAGFEWPEDDLDWLTR